MKTFTALAFAGAAVAQSCSDSRDGTFNIQISNVTSSASKRSISTRQLDGPLTVRLQKGVLTDQAGRTGNVVANHQFQFDSPIQAGSLYKDGFSVCENGTLTHQGSAIWYQCLSGSFYNLYDQSLGGQCNPVYFIAVGGGSNSGAQASQQPDGQPAVSSAAPTPSNAVSQIPDGQPQAPTGAATPPKVISQISDGQPQAPTGAASPPNLISQISDGQPQAPTGAATPPKVISQISDGQPQAPTGAASPPNLISQISDGQPQAPTGTPPSTTPANLISQISDGQPQAPTPVSPQPPLVSQISDGQPQAPTSPLSPPYPTTKPLVSQIADGQPQAPLASGTGVPTTSANISVPEAQFPGAAAAGVAVPGVGMFVGVVGVLVGGLVGGL